MDYSYPLNYDWSVEEMTDVIALYTAVEQAYEKGIQKEDFMKAYRQFKTIVDSKSEEKQLDAAFKEVSGYSIYKVKKACEENTWVKL